MRRVNGSKHANEFHIPRLVISYNIPIVFSLYERHREPMRCWCRLYPTWKHSMCPPVVFQSRESRPRKILNIVKKSHLFHSACQVFSTRIQMFELSTLQFSTVGRTRSLMNETFFDWSFSMQANSSRVRLHGTPARDWRKIAGVSFEIGGVAQVFHHNGGVLVFYAI